MKYKKYDGNSYNIYTIKTDKFKSCIINVVFKDKLEKYEDLASLNMLKAVMSDNNKTYNKHRKLAIRKEELYNTSFYTDGYRVGDSYLAKFGVEFIAPEYIKEENYLDEVIKFYFDMILNPNVTNDEFDLKTFNLEKENMILSLKRIHENSTKYSVKRSLQTSSIDSFSTKYLEEEDYEKVTPSSLYKVYQKLINNSFCEVYIIGNLDMDSVVSKIKRAFNIKMIKNHEYHTYIYNDKVKKVKVTKEKDNFLQAHLIMGYNIDELNLKEKIAFSVFKEILAGGLNSKLYQKLRNENSLCYSLTPIYFKYDSLMLIHVSFDEKNYKKCVSMINQEIREIKNGNISDDEFERVIKYIRTSIKLSSDNISDILSNYIVHNYDQIPLIEEYESKLLEITIDDVVNIVNKLSANFVYLLSKGDESNGKD